MTRFTLLFLLSFATLSPFSSSFGESFYLGPISAELPEGAARIPVSPALSLYRGKDFPGVRGYTDLGTDLDEAHRGAWPGLPVGVGTIREALIWTYTDGADPEGVNGLKPITPTATGNIEIVFGGEVIYRRKFTGEGDPIWPKVRAVTQQDYREIKERNVGDLSARFLGSLERKYSIEADKFVPDDMEREAAKRPRTSFAESFPTESATLSSQDLTWTELGGTQTTEVDSSLELVASGSGSIGTFDLARAEHDVSSTDHWVSMDYVGGIPAVGARISNSAESGYACLHQGNGTVRLYRLDSGVETQLTTGTGTYGSTELKIDVDGSTITVYVGDVEACSTTDTTHTNGTRGVAGGKSDFSGTNWIIDDGLGGGGSAFRKPLQTGRIGHADL